MTASIGKEISKFSDELLSLSQRRIGNDEPLKRVKYQKFLEKETKDLENSLKGTISAFSHSLAIRLRKQMDIVPILSLEKLAFPEKPVPKRKDGVIKYRHKTLPRTWEIPQHLATGVFSFLERKETHSLQVVCKDYFRIARRPESFYFEKHSDALDLSTELFQNPDFKISRLLPYKNVISLEIELGGHASLRAKPEEVGIESLHLLLPRVQTLGLECTAGENKWPRHLSTFPKVETFSLCVCNPATFSTYLGRYEFTSPVNFSFSTCRGMDENETKAQCFVGVLASLPAGSQLSFYDEVIQSLSSVFWYVYYPYETTPHFSFLFSFKIKREDAPKPVKTEVYDVMDRR